MKTLLSEKEINSSGKNRNFINDTPVLLNTLAQFANKQIEIFSQNNNDFIKNEKIDSRLLIIFRVLVNH